MRHAANQAKLIVGLALAIFFVTAAPATAGLLQPGPGKVFFGVSDTGVNSQFKEFSELIGKHPPVIESFRSWAAPLTGAVRRWQRAMARPILHISTADPITGEERITPREIATGYGDTYLIFLNNLFWSKGIRAYIRPLGEPNRCLNVYASYDCEGKLRDAAHKPYWYRQAFRRMYILLHGGGKLEKIDRRLERAGLRPLNPEQGPVPEGLPKAPVAVVWSPLPAGSPEVRWNRPERFFPGLAYTDWAGTDFYSAYPDWKALSAMYARYGRRRPFVLTEWGVENTDDPRFVRRLFVWVERHPRTKMLVYYQDFGSSNPFRIQNFPASLGVIRRHVSSPEFPTWAFEPPVPEPPPPAG